MYAPFTSYAPDGDPRTPGVIVDCSALVPSTRGFAGAPTPVATTLPALAAQCFGAASMRTTGDNTRIFAGSASKLYEGATSSWTDRTAVGGYSVTSSQRWRFAQFGDAMLAAAKSNIVQFIDSGTTFAAVTTTAPKCGVIETVNNFVFGFDVSDQGALYDSADRPDGWWCAAKGGYGDWDPSVTTEAATGTLKETPGRITGARKFGYQIVAYKQNSMYVGTYVGQPQIWSFEQVPGDAGALSHEAIVNVGTSEEPKHIFMGADNFYQFSGAQRPIPVGNPVREKVFGELNIAYAYAAIALHDRQNKLIYFWYPVASSNKPDKCVVFHYPSGRWGRSDRQIEAVVDFVATGLTYGDLGTYYTTYADLPDAPYGTAFVIYTATVPALFDTSHQLSALTGTAASASITTGDSGDGINFATLSRVRPYFLSGPASATYSHFYRDGLPDALTAGYVASLSSGRFDLSSSARWHRGVLSISGAFEIAGLDHEFVVDGEE